MTSPPAFVVLGGAGRVGGHLLPLLASSTGVLVTLSRRPRSTDRVTWLTADLTVRPSALQAVADLVGHATHVTVVDLVLDRGSVTAMRRSIAASTAFSIALHRRLGRTGTASRLVVAGTTAALAPYGLRTPYGIAKHHQGRRYSREHPLDLVLLPQLSAGGERTFAQAARALADVIATSPAARRLWVLRPPAAPAVPRVSPTRLPQALAMSVAARTTHRSDPGAFRRASHAWLDQLPQPARVRLDHHHAPPLLLWRFARCLGLPPALPLTTEDDGHGSF
ncbi:hypothetical protein E5083_01950 [Streptomyces bauhiniae]|uniref:NAD-dependent epimerase/dehydratase domain-containing protein n=1 Tax=Streptomyces bauhiniae TaxID=2340725 RepID=A0A4Z1DF66_9ACTN|nr:NAD-dependent epimerase/dehydratase family protein [Streptomyces bauhiniae]TGN81308.1 hypothetical protein E5083_01950 [Streptomyces bauhiniae]